MVIGNILMDRNDQYVASRDEHGTWRILNAWHPALKELSIDADVPDTHPAVTLVTEGAFLALIKEATSRNILAGMTEGHGGISPEEYDGVCQERDSLMSQVERLKIEIPKTSETLKIAEGKIALIDRLASLYPLDESIVQLILTIGGNERVH